MRFRVGLAIGFGAGYYLGAKAGRPRYEQMQQWLNKAKDSDLVETAAEKAKAVAEIGKERARDLVERARHDDEDEDEATQLMVEVPVAQGHGNGGPERQ
ncbi:MAG: hypothetical protein ACRD29_15890 [Acidimicrobiales bacterium]